MWVQLIISLKISVYVLDKACPIGTSNVYAIKHETRGRVVCVTGMQFMVAMYTDKPVWFRT